MKAVVCNNFGDPHQVAKVIDVDPSLAPVRDQVKIAVGYASVSHATELLIRGSYQSNPPLPFTPGTEVFGRILACGPDNTRFKVGDRVIALTRWGGYAQQITLAPQTVYAVSDTLDWTQALPLGLSYGTAYSALVWRAHMTPADYVLVLGAGSGVGLAAVEIASALGATVIAVASSPEKRAVALAHGAHAAFAPDSALVQNIKTATNGGATIIFDPVGAELMEQVFKSAAQGAQILSIGFAAGRPAQLAPNIMLVKNISLYGFFFGQYIGWTHSDSRARYEDMMVSMMRALQQLVVTERIKPKIVKTYAMENLCDALDDLNARSIIGKVALSINGDIT